MLYLVTLCILRVSSSSDGWQVFFPKAAPNVKKMSGYSWRIKCSIMAYKRKCKEKKQSVWKNENWSEVAISPCSPPSFSLSLSLSIHIGSGSLPLPPLSLPFKTLVYGSRPPVKPAGCKSATVTRTAATLASCKSAARPAHRRPPSPAAGTAVWSHTQQPGWWRGWQRRPGSPDPPWKTCPWSARRRRRWSTPRRCQGRRWRRWSLWRCQWMRRRTGPGWQQLCWQMYLNERDKNFTEILIIVRDHHL